MRTVAFVALTCVPMLFSPLAGRLRAEVATAQNAKDRLKDLPAYIENALAQTGAPGLACSVVVQDQVVFTGGFGVRRLGEKENVDAKTLFQIGSCTKAFAAVLVGVAIDDGKVGGFDDPLIDYLPAVRLYDPWVTQSATLRDFLVHRTGLGSQSGTELLWPLGFSGSASIARLGYLPKGAPFRTRFLYNNVGYLAAGVASARAEEIPWEAFAQTRLFEPLKMARTLPSARQIRNEPNVATPHALLDGRWQIVPRNTGDVGPAGSILSCAQDMTQWLRLLLAGGTVDGKTVVTKETLDEILAPQLAVGLRPNVGDETHDPTSTMTLGAASFDYHGYRVVAANGDIDGMATVFLVVPAASVGVFLTTNSNSDAVRHPLVMWILDRLFDFPQTDRFAEFFEKDTARRQHAERAQAALEEQWRKGRLQNTRPSRQLFDYLGTYHCEPWGDLVIGAEQEKLVLTLGKRTVRCELEHWQVDTFRTRLLAWSEWNPFFVRFDLDPSGAVYRLYLQSPDDGILAPANDHPFVRVAD